MKILHLPLIIPAAILLGFSLLILSSISEKYFWYQLSWIAIGSGFFVIFHYFDWRPFINYYWFAVGIYAVIVALLILTFLFAPTIRGNRAWLVIGPIQFQASEFAKAGLILVFAYFLRRHHLSIGNLKTIMSSFLIVALPMGLVVLEPDLGSAVVIGALWFLLIVLSGLRWKHLMVSLLILALVVVLAWTSFLADYQKNRIIGLFHPERDPLGINYSVIQSKVAIGSAGFWGKGYHQGTQVQLGFLPEPQTDFIFPAFIEEWGIIGGFLIIFTFLYLIFGILKVGALAATNFEKFVCLGSAVIMSLHFIINVSSGLGFFPVIGVPFPFLSYGGSNLISNLFLLGLVNSIAKRLS